MNDREFDSLKGSLLISRIVYAKMSAITGGTVLIFIALIAKALFSILDWGDIAVALFNLGICVHAFRTQTILVNIWGRQLLTVGQIEAFDLLHQAQANLKQRGWS